MSRYRVLTVKDLPRLRSELEANGWQVTQKGNTLECTAPKAGRKTAIKATGRTNTAVVCKEGIFYNPPIFTKQYNP